MAIWQADFYRRPQQDQQGQTLWELLICDPTRRFTYEAICPQREVNIDWLVSQLQQAATGQPLPEFIQIFRPQCLEIFQAAGQQLGIKIDPTRRTTALKQWLQERTANLPGYDPLALDKPPPVPLPDHLWGDRWRFATLPAGQLVEAFSDRPIPILQMPEFLLPLNLGLASTVPIPGVVIYGGRQSMRLAHWLQNTQPVALNYIIGPPDGLVLHAGLVDRWIVATFEDSEVAAAARTYEERKLPSKGLHFLVVQPDESGMTYSGFWLLKPA
jgi:hypothetical protein